MERILVKYHKGSDTIDIWFGNPEDEHVCEEAGEGVIFKKDKEGKIIGIERLYVSKILGICSFPVEVSVE